MILTYKAISVFCEGFRNAHKRSDVVKDKRPLRVAMLGHKHVPSREGGVEVVVSEISTRLIKNGCEVTCYNRSGHHVSGRRFNSSDMKEYKGVKLKNVPTLKGRGIAAISSSFFAAIACAFGKYDVVHFHAEGPAAMCWLPKLLGKKVIVTIHGIDWKREKWHEGLGAKYIRLGEKIAVKFADEIIVLSKCMQKYFSDTYGRETNFIPNGVNRPEIRKADIIEKAFGLTKNSYILYLGRIVPEKGLNYLIEAFNCVKTDKKLVIAGGISDTGKFYKSLKRETTKNDRIIFTGVVQGETLDELYSNAYIYCLPSDLEGMPLSLLEAMSYGNCCLVSDISECAKVVEDKAVIFKKGDTVDLVLKLQNLLDDEFSVTRYKAESADYICHKYNWSEVVNSTLALYI